MRIFSPCGDADGVAAAAADDFVELARRAIRERGRFTVALSGGTTPRGLYRLLAEERRGEVEWEHVEIFWGDERAVPPDHPESNYGLAARELLDHVPVRSEHVHRIHGEHPDGDAAARAYQTVIARVFRAPETAFPPPFDLVLLGLGADGHTASLFAGSPGLAERRRWVVCHHVAALGVTRFTLTVPVLVRAREIRVMVTGADKAETLRAVLQGRRDPQRLPIQAVRPMLGRMAWLVDDDAAGRLRAAGVTA
ncbi:MAG: 6-phosphogluconolactonase [Candidatus Rokubacteria bacterium]|nr:6-phosphogluconolactonase [Candidatus Rokubacteria bacterium]